MIQPPRGFGENPIAIYHDPDLPPSHHYLAAYRWLSSEDGGFGRTPSCTSASTGRSSGCRARASGLSPECAPDAVPRRPAAVLPVHRQRPG
jgi:cobaltochelatase CobN